MALTKAPAELLNLDSGITITTADNTEQLTLLSTDADASQGPSMAFYRNSSSPADSDDMGNIYFYGENDNDEKIEYGRIRSILLDASDGTEDSNIRFWTMAAGSLTDNLALAGGSVGIGVSAPDSKLHVKHAGGGFDEVARLTSVANSAGDGAFLGFHGNSTSKFYGFVGGYDIGTNEGGVKIGVGNGETTIADSMTVLTIDNDGKVGINSTALNEDITFASPTGGEERVLEFKCDNSNDYWSILPYDRTNSHGVKLHLGTGGQLKVLNNNAVTVGDSLIYAHPSNGMVSINTTSQQGRLKIESDSGSKDLLVLNNVKSGSDLGVVTQFRREGTGTGYIANTSSATTYATSQSDRRAKKNFEDWTESVLSHFKDLKPTKFHFTQEDDSSEKNKGYIAQDLVGSFPEAYPTKNDGEDADRYFFNPGGMVVYLMKAIQEQQVLIETLQTKVKALEET